TLGALEGELDGGGVGARGQLEVVFELVLVVAVEDEVDAGVEVGVLDGAVVDDVGDPPAGVAADVVVADAVHGPDADGAGVGVGAGSTGAGKVTVGGRVPPPWVATTPAPELPPPAVPASGPPPSTAGVPAPEVRGVVPPAVDGEPPGAAAAAGSKGETAAEEA